MLYFPILYESKAIRIHKVHNITKLMSEQVQVNDSYFDVSIKKLKAKKDKQKAFSYDLFKNLSFKFSQSKKLSKYCRDPSTDELDNILSYNYKLNIDKIKEGIKLYPPVQKKYERFLLKPSELVNNINTTGTLGDTSCTQGEQTVWYPYEIAVCPYHFVDIVRDDRYPFNIKHAVCNCKNCIGFKSKISNCVPTFIASPVLSRSDCMSDGFFEWKYSMEFVPVSCSCKHFLIID